MFCGDKEQVVYHWDKYFSCSGNYMEKCRVYPLFFILLDIRVKVMNTGVTHLHRLLLNVLCTSHVYEKIKSKC